MSLALGPVWLLRIAPDTNTQYMNYIFALTFVIASFAFSLFSVFLDQSSVSSPAAFQRGEEKAEKKKKRNDCAGVSKPGMKEFFFLLFLAFQEFGIFMGHYCRSPPFNFICRKHTLFASGLQKLKARPCDHDLAAEGAKLCEANGIQHLWKPYTINNKTRLWK